MFVIKRTIDLSTERDFEFVGFKQTQVLLTCYRWGSRSQVTLNDSLTAQWTGVSSGVGCRSEGPRVRASCGRQHVVHPTTLFWGTEMLRPVFIYHAVFCLQEDIPRQLVYIGLYLFHIAGAYLLKWVRIFLGCVWPGQRLCQSVFTDKSF